MGAPVFKEGFHRGEFLVSEANGSLSRDVITLAQRSISYSSGQVVSFVTASNKYVAYDETGAGDVKNARAVLFDNVDATAGDVQAVAITRNAEVNKLALAFQPNATNAGIAAAYASLGQFNIIAR